jgi:hypothetical protein
MDILVTLVITVVVQLAGYAVTNRVVEDTAEIIATEVRDSVMEEKRRRRPD